MDVLDSMTSAKVFQNPVLMNKILRNVPEGLLRNLHIRLISKLFDNYCMNIIRKDYHKMKIEYLGKDIHEQDYSEQPEVETFDTPVYINYQLVKVKELGKLFRFLKDIEVKIKDVFLKNLWMLREYSREFIHDNIIAMLERRENNNIRSMIGMSDLCYGCRNCNEIGRKCKEVGSIITGILSRSELHFEKMILTEQQLDFYGAGRVVTSARFFFENLIRFLNPRVTCDTLEFHIAERRIYDNIDDEDDGDEEDGDEEDGDEEEQEEEMENNANHALIPREIIETIIKIRKAKNITIKMIHNTPYRYSSVDWSTTSYLKTFRFNDPYETVEEKERKPIIEKVNVDLSDSVNCVKGILGNDEKWESYQNLIANIRRLFSTNHISISFSHWSLFEGNAGIASHNFLNNILKTVFKEDQQNLRVDFQYFSKVDQLKYIDSSFHFKSNQFQITPRHSSISKKRFFEEKFLLEKWIGRNLKFEDKKKNCLINLEILINENEFGKNVSQEILQDYPNSFAKYFIN